MAMFPIPRSAAMPKASKLPARVPILREAPIVLDAMVKFVEAVSEAGLVKVAYESKDNTEWVETMESLLPPIFSVCDMTGGPRRQNDGPPSAALI
jgi:hypothetical protein